MAQARKTNDNTSPAYLLEIGDLYPHIARFLGSKEFQRMCSDGVLANFVRSRRGAWLDPKKARAGLALARTGIPERVTLGISRGAVLSACKTIWISNLLEMVEGLREARTDVAARQEQRFITVLKQLFLQPLELDVVLTVDMPTKGAARSALRGFSDGLVEGLSEELGGIVMEEAEKSTTVRFDPDKFFADKELVDAFRNSIADVSEELVKPVLAASRNWRLTLVGQAVDKQFRIRLTTAADPGQLPRFVHRRKRATGQGPLLTLSWDHGPLRESIQRILRSWRAARGAMGSIQLSEDVTTVLGVLERIDGYLESSTMAGSMRCSIDDALRFTTLRNHEHGGSVPPLQDAGLHRLVPRHAEYVWLTSHMNLPRMLQNVLTTMDLGLAIGGKAAEAIGTGSLASLGPVARSFRNALGPLSRTLEERGTDGFEPGAALLVTTQGQAYDHGPRRGMEVPALALAGRPKDRNTAILFTRAVGRAVASARGADLDSIAKRTSKDSKLEVPVFSLTWKSHEDLGLHMFMIGEYLVITTSKALGARIQSAFERRSARAPALGVGSRRKDLTEIRETSGSRLLDLLRRGRNSLYTLMPRSKRSRSIVFELQPLEVPFHLVGHVRSETWVENNTVKTATSIQSVLPWIVPLPDTEARLKALRDKLGEWPREWVAVRATGKCRWGSEGLPAYRFLFARHGDYRNEIDGLNGVRNTWNGQDSLSRFNNHRFTCRTGGDQLHPTWYFSQIMSGAWCRGMPNTEVQWCLDKDSGERFFLFRKRDDDIAYGVYLDARTGLPRRARSLPRDPRNVYESRTLVYEDYRRVDGVFLPHKVYGMHRFGWSAEFLVSGWEGVREVKEELFAQELRDDNPAAFEASIDPKIEMRKLGNGQWVVRATRDDRAPEWHSVSITTPFACIHAANARYPDLGWAAEGREKIRKLRLGPAVFTDVPADRVNLSFLADKGEPVGGMLGLAVFKRLCTELNLVGKQMLVYPPGRWKNTQDRPWVDMSMSPSSFHLPARVDGHPGLFHVALSSYYKHGVEIYPSFVETHRLLKGKRHHPWNQTRYVLSWLKSLDVSGLHLTGTRCAFAVSSEFARDLEGMAGQLVLGNLDLARILIDGPRQRIALIPKAEEHEK